jgi:hypothetical protein
VPVPAAEKKLKRRTWSCAAVHHKRAAGIGSKSTSIGSRK